MEVIAGAALVGPAKTLGGAGAPGPGTARAPGRPVLEIINKIKGKKININEMKMYNKCNVK